MNAEGENHRSPLHEATSAGHVSIIELLIKRGADPCSRDSQDATPYDLAYAEGHQEVCTTLYNVCTCTPSLVLHVCSCRVIP